MTHCWQTFVLAYPGPPSYSHLTIIKNKNNENALEEECALISSSKIGRTDEQTHSQPSGGYQSRVWPHLGEVLGVGIFLGLENKSCQNFFDVVSWQSIQSSGHA